MISESEKLEQKFWTESKWSVFVRKWFESKKSLKCALIGVIFEIDFYSKNFQVVANNKKCLPTKFDGGAIWRFFSLAIHVKQD